MNVFPPSVFLLFARLLNSRLKFKHSSYGATLRLERFMALGIS